LLPVEGIGCTACGTQAAGGIVYATDYNAGLTVAEYTG
jgi:hypothetical protein